MMLNQRAVDFADLKDAASNVNNSSRYDLPDYEIAAQCAFKWALDFFTDWRNIYFSPRKRNRAMSLARKGLLIMQTEGARFNYAKGQTALQHIERCHHDQKKSGYQ